MERKVVFLNLNEAQRKVVEAIHGDYVVIAGPGSGKTACLIQRFMGMRAQGIAQRDILNLTFTNAAATEMVERVGLMGADSVFRTFHSFAIELLKAEAVNLPFRVCETIIPVRGEQFQLMKDLLKMYPAITSYRSLAEKLSEWKRNAIDPSDALQDEYTNGKGYFYALAYRDYERKCREQGWLDFDSLMQETVKLLETNDAVKERNTKKFIAVDECQDTDTTQFRLLKLIYGGNIFVVGDENQLIYEWRSAQTGNLSNFARTFPGACTLYLGQNYRSTRRLVDFFRHIIPVDNGLASHMTSERPIGDDPVIIKYQDEYQEFYHTLSKITDTENTAVIARTNRQLLQFQKACLARNIKSQILGKKDLWHQNEVKHLLDLAKENVDKKGPASEVLTSLIAQHNLSYIYRNSGSPNEKDPVENLNDMVKLAAKRGTTEEFLNWFRKLTYARKSSKNPILTLTTVHQAKGREWKNVFVIGASQGMMPHKDGELLEEHRIFFVACSRAADKLYISFSGNRSQFLNDFQEQIHEYFQEADKNSQYRPTANGQLYPKSPHVG